MNIILSLLMVILSSATPTLVEAHLLQTDHLIGAVMHIDPDDDPIVGQQSTFFLEFKDKAGKFSPDLCDCSVSIERGGKQIFTEQLSQPDSQFSFTFPARDVYRVIIAGTPMKKGNFAPFSLAYNIRVSRISGAPDASNPWIFRSISAIAVSIILVVALRVAKRSTD